MTIASGSGIDTLNLDHLTVGSLSANTAGGPDTITLQSVTASSANITAGNSAANNAHTLVTIGNATHAVAIAQNLAISVGTSNEVVKLDNLHAGSLTIHAGDSDNVTVGALWPC